VVTSVHGQTETISIDRALLLARANRPSVTAAQNRLQSARLTSRALGTFPATSLFVGYSSPAEVGGSDDDLVLVQPVDIFGRTAAARAAGRAMVMKAEAELLKVHADLQFEVFERYSEAVAAKALAESATESQEIARRLYDSIKSLVDEGRLPGVQLTRVEVEHERAKLTTNQRQAELAANIQGLAGLVNVPSDKLAIGGFPEVAIGSLATGRRPDLMVLAAEVSAAQAEAWAARLIAMPELELQGRRTAWQETDQKYGVRVQLSFPLFDYGKSRAESGAAQRLVTAARQSEQDAIRLADSELAAAKIEFDAATRQVIQFEAIAKTTHDLVEKSRIGFTERAVTLIELLEATRALREVDESMAESKLRLAKAQANYLRASGQVLEVKA
jgi:outer membrane protein TolC